MSTRTVANWLTQIAQYHPQSIALGLERVQQVMSRLSLPARASATVITVAGTNGKGSTVATLSALLNQAGKRVATYTSPHLFAFNERIQINAQPIDDAALVDCFQQVEQARYEIPLTYFEFTTLAAIVYFTQARCDYWVLEVGMGGRLDAVNVIEPDIAVITSVSFDHMAHLGPTIADIAREKAGIVRPGKPICLAMPKPPHALLDDIASKAAELHQCGVDYQAKRYSHQWQLRCNDQLYTSLPLPGLPIQPFACAVYVFRCLLGYALSTTQLQSLCETVQLPGRFQSIGYKPRIVLDVAHNVEAAQHLAARIQQLQPTGKVLALFACNADKDSVACMKAMRHLVDYWYVARTASDAAADPIVLAKALGKLSGVTPHTFLSVPLAFREAYSVLEPRDMLIVFGSFAIVVEVTALVKQQMSATQFAELSLNALSCPVC